MTTENEVACTRPEEPTDLSPSQELYRMEEAANGDGTVEVTAHDWAKYGDTVEVFFITPTGDVESDKMAWPEGTTKGTKFKRVLDAAGYSTVDAKEFGEHGRTLRADPDDWTLVPDRSVPRRWARAFKNRTHEGVFESMVKGASLPVIGHAFIAALIDQTEPNENPDFLENAIYSGKNGVRKYKRDRAMFFGLLTVDLLFILTVALLL